MTAPRFVPTHPFPITTGPVIETERLILRLPMLDDFEPGAAFLATERTRFMGGIRDRAEAWRSTATWAGHWMLRGYGFFAITRKSDGAVIGHCGPHMPIQYSEVELGYSLWRDDLEGHGFATEAVRAARDWAWTNVPYPQGFVSYIDPANSRSIAVARRLGAVEDTTATHPFGEETCLVFRHPTAEPVQ